MPQNSSDETSWHDEKTAGELKWFNILKNTKDVQPAHHRITNEVSAGFQLYLDKINGIQNPNLDSYDRHLQVRLSLFDVVYHRFLGRTFRSNFFNVQSQLVNLDMPLYFHTSIVDANLLIVFELVMTEVPKNPLPDADVTTKLQSYGWGFYRMFKSNQQLRDVVDGGELPISRVEFFQGTPRALFYLNDPIESNPNLKLITGCQITFSFRSHASLGTVQHLLLENVFYAGTDPVTGIAKKMSAASGDYLVRPAPLQTRDVFVDQLKLDLGTTIDRFEEELCRMVKDDRVKSDRIPTDGKAVLVTERRLMVGVHNGECYVRKPQFVHLEPENAVTSSDRGNTMGSFGKGKRKEVSTISLTSSCNLVLRSRIRLEEMIPDPQIAIVFQLQYILSVPVSPSAPAAGSMSSMVSQPLTVMLRWGVWLPYSHPSRPSTIIISLMGSEETTNPDSFFFYKSKSLEPESSSAGNISFSFLTSDHPTSSPGPICDVIQGPTMQSQSAEAVEEFEFSKLQISQQSTAATSTTHLPEDLSRDIVYQVEMTHLETRGEAPPVHAPPILPLAHRPTSLTRATYARLYSAGFTDVTDRRGNPAHEVDANDQNFSWNLERNLSDSLQANEITIQFLAFSTPPAQQATADTGIPPPAHKISSVFFTFQFYRFTPVTTQRCSLTGGNAVTDPNEPRVLRKIEAGEQLDDGRPGLDVKYHVDPNHLRSGESVSFLKYLSSHNLHIDVWDGDSLMLIGSVALPLKHILRGGKPAVSCHHELDVISSEYNDSSTLTGDLTTGGSVRPIGLMKLWKGCLHLRLGNVGHLPEKKISPAAHLRESPLVVADLTGRGFSGGGLLSSLNNHLTQPRSGKCKVKKLADTNPELSDLLLLAVGNKHDSSGKENDVELSREDRQRKIVRMNAVRDHESRDLRDHAANGTSGEKITSVGQRALLNAQERTLQLRDLQTIHEYREKLKPDYIAEMLLLSVTTHHVIRPTLGVAEFVELQLRNPLNLEQNVTVECDNPALRVITDVKEWRCFKQHNKLNTPVEENMFTFHPTTGQPQIFLRPKETVFIPFRYQGYEADHSMTSQGPSQFFKTTAHSSMKSSVESGLLESKIIRVVMRTGEGRPMSVLQLKVEPQPHVVDQTFRFYNPEQTFLKKCIRLPPFNETSGENQFHVVCSDPEVVCQARVPSRDDPREIFIKSPCGESPTVRRFFLAIYSDAYLAHPVQIWQFYVHALQRVDVTCVLGQTSRVGLALRGKSTSRLVRCFSSHPFELQVEPQQAFMLPSNGIAEIDVGVRSVTSQVTRFMYINVVDTEYHQLVRNWLVAVKTREPVVTKEFNIELPRSGGKACNKMITYTNPYPHPKAFQLQTSRADLLQFRDSAMQLGSGEKTTIGLRFSSGVSRRGKSPVHIFINDPSGKNEETFLVNVTYV